MAATESDIIRDEQERSSLLRTIAGVETAIANSTPSTRRVLENTLENAKKRVVALDKKIEQAKAEHAAEVQAQATAAATLAAKEYKLSAEEKETYRSFLEEPYFTKKDFGKLDRFYTHSYGRLSEGGKDEMSKRFWEGVRRGEYQFEDAPSVIQRKEAERVQNRLGLNDSGPEQLRRMSGEEQRTFADACNSDDHTEARRVLARCKSAVRSGGTPSALKGDHASTKENNSATVADIDLSAVDLKDVELVPTTSEPTAAAIPDASGQRLVRRG